MTLGNARALTNPFVVRVEDARQIMIGIGAARNVMTGADDAESRHVLLAPVAGRLLLVRLPCSVTPCEKLRDCDQSMAQRAKQVPAAAQASARRAVLPGVATG